MKDLIPQGKVRVIAPAGPVDPARLEAGKAFLHSLQMEIHQGAHVLDVFGHLAGTDLQRSQDLMDALLDENADWVWSLRGGFGTARLLKTLEWNRLQGLTLAPLVGYSDLTALQNAFLAVLGQVSWHAPMLATECCGELDPLTRASLMWMLGIEEELPEGVALLESSRSIEGGSPTVRFTHHDRKQDFLLHLSSSDVVFSGEAHGTLMGGNLSVLTSLLGSPWFPKTEGAILALEDHGEYPFRLDRHFTQLTNAGVLENLSGVVLGHFEACHEPDEQKSTFSFEELIEQHLGSLHIPVVRIPFGHAAPRLSLPLGGDVQIRA